MPSASLHTLNPFSPRVIERLGHLDEGNPRAVGSAFLHRPFRDLDGLRPSGAAR